LEIVVFIVIALVWAFFLLPSFFDNRRQAPMSSTRSFARSTALLASVANSPAHEVTSRRMASTRRRRVLVGLGAGAVAALLLAITGGSALWLTVAILFDLALSAYVGLLVAMRQRASALASVITIERAAEPVVVDAQRHTVRVVAG
jgi:hypothetical protein